MFNCHTENLGKKKHYLKAIKFPLLSTQCNLYEMPFLTRTRYRRYEKYSLLYQLLKNPNNKQNLKWAWTAGAGKQALDMKSKNTQTEPWKHLAILMLINRSTKTR